MNLGGVAQRGYRHRDAAIGIDRADGFGRGVGHASDFRRAPRDDREEQPPAATWTEGAGDGGVDDPDAVERLRLGQRRLPVRFARRER